VRYGSRQAYRFIEKGLENGPKLEAAYNAVYTGEAVWDVVLFAAMTQRTPEAAVKILRDRGKKAPSPDVVHRRLRQASTKNLVEIFTPCLEEAFKEAKRQRLLQTPKRVAVDIHEKPFYGDAEGTVRGRPKQGTTTFWAYLSLDIVQEGCRFTLAALPLKDKKRAAELVEALLRYSLRWIRICVVLLDRFFYRADVISAVEGLGLDWLMAAKTSKRMRRMAREAREEDRPCFMYTMNPGEGQRDVFPCLHRPIGEGRLPLFRFQQGGTVSASLG